MFTADGRHETTHANRTPVSPSAVHSKFETQDGLFLPVGRMSRVVLMPASEIDQTSIRVARRLPSGLETHTVYAIERLPELRIDRTIRSGAVLSVTRWSCCPRVRTPSFGW
jgi:hypothetical protein